MANHLTRLEHPHTRVAGFARLAVCACILSIATGSVVAATFTSTDVPKAIPDSGTATSVLTASGLSGTISDVNVTLSINHPFDADLDVYLESPSGKTVELFTDVGKTGANFNDTTLDDEAGTVISDGTAPFSGTYKPKGKLSSLRGRSPNGTWTLRINDDAGYDVGKLNNWSITLLTGSPRPTVTSFTPTSGAIGTSVTILGAGFSGATAVTFNGTPATFTVNTSTQITAIVPAGASAGAIRVTTPSGMAGGSGNFTVYDACVSPPILQTEPATTPGTANTITWSAVTGAGEYYAECAANPGISPVFARSGWIPGTNYTFAALTTGQTYWYRVKARTGGGSGGTWSQTTQAEFDTDTLSGTSNTTVPGDVLLAARPAEEITGRILNPSFELDDNSSGPYPLDWTRQSTGTPPPYYGYATSLDCYEGAQSLAMGTSYGDTLAVGTSRFFTQDVDLTGAKELRFYFNRTAASGLELRLYVGGDLKFATASNEAVPWTMQTVDLGGYDGMKQIKIGVWVVLPISNKYTMARVDYLRLFAASNGYASAGSITSNAISLPPASAWGSVTFNKTAPAGTELRVDVLQASDNSVLLSDISSGASLNGIVAASIKLRANLSTADPSVTPALHDWSVTYAGPAGCESDWSNVEHSHQTNVAPVLDNSGTMSLAAIDEDDNNNEGTLVSAMIASAGEDRISDPDPGAVEGIAVAEADTTHGVWEYSITPARSWTSLGTPSATAARLLAADAHARIRFVPAPNFNGTLSNAVTFRAWDQTTGSNGGTADTTVSGGGTAFSTASETAGITVNPVNDPPTALCRDVIKPPGDGCQAHATAEFDDGSFDIDGDPITFQVDPPGPFPLGTTSVNLTVTDAAGLTAVCVAAITVGPAPAPPTVVSCDLADNEIRYQGAAITSASIVFSTDVRGPQGAPLSGDDFELDGDPALITGFSYSPQTYTAHLTFAALSDRAWHTFRVSGQIEDGCGTPLNGNTTGTLAGENHHWIDVGVLRADFRHDGYVDVIDRTQYLAAWTSQKGQPGPNLSADYQLDGDVDVIDRTQFLAAWTAQRAAGASLGPAPAH